MSDFNTDTADRAELEQAASDLGVKFQSNTSDDKLRSRINEHLGSPTPDEAKSSGQAAPGESKKAKRYRLIVATNEQDKQPVQIGVNGRNYVIERGKEVVVPESVVEVLRNAVQHQYDPHTMEEIKVMAYPFQVLGEA